MAHFGGGGERGGNKCYKSNRYPYEISKHDFHNANVQVSIADPALI